MRKLIDLDKLARMDKLIRSKTTGTPEQLAKKLKISKSCLYEIIAFLKEVMYAPIVYHGGKQTYVYEYSPKFYIGMGNETLNKDEMQNTYGSGVENSPKKNSKRTIEIEIDDDQIVLDEDTNFNELYLCAE
ncbi:MAG: hypothetical protein FWH18_07285 [Marinilabiliaceae bacterium]|nr:hypothetical protein [Marinilabiliaceae bacterium]